jgi:uncharacterized membrane protein YobD (UPF0266 family)
MIAVPVAAHWRWLPLVAPWLLALLLGLWRRRGTGAVLIDMGGSKDRGFLFVFSTALVVLGIVGIFRTHRIVLDTSLVLAGVGVGLITWQTMRFQLREAGFWSGNRLIPWDKIEAFEVSEIGSLSLKLSGKSQKFYCDVPPALRQQAEDLLASKCHALKPLA